MKKTTFSNEFTRSSRTFNYDQLVKISDDNFGYFNQNINMSPFHPDDIFVLKPTMVHEPVFGEPGEPYLTTMVKKLNESKELCLQDLFLYQWEQGSEIISITPISEDSDLPF